MNSVTLKLIATLALFAAVAAPFRLTAQVGQKQVHYQLVDLGTLGGSQGNAYGGVTNRRWVTGDSNLPGDQNEHAFLWRNGKMQDLGTLGGPNSSTASVIKNNAGFIMGIAQIAELDPRAEYWGSGFFCTTVNCQGFKYLDRGFLWKDGEMTALPTLGGNNSQAYGVNSRGQVVGLAEKANAAIPACAPPQLLEFQAVVWSPGEDEIQVLPPLPGDAIGAALAINDSGQVVGGSGVCGVPFSNVLAHAVLWQDGKPIDLGNFGGVMNNYADAINNRGQAVGASDLPGDTVGHAFLWSEGVLTDLGTLAAPLNAISIANDINEKGQIVGVSCDPSFNCHAVLWQNGAIVDLNSLTLPGTSLQLVWGAGINDQGEIAGTALDPNTGNTSAFLAIPNRKFSWVSLDAGVASGSPLPENVRKLLSQRAKRFPLGRN